MNRVRVSWIAVGALAALVIAAAGSAQVREKESVDFAVTGEIMAVDAEAQTLTVKGANDDGGVYHVNDKTTIMSGDRKIGLDDLTPGWRVTLNGDSGLDGKTKTATYIEVVDTAP
jgi:hypothetical protein